MNLKDAARSEIERLPSSSSFSQKAELLRLGRRIRQSDCLLLLGTPQEKEKALQAALHDVNGLKRSADLVEGGHIAPTPLSASQKEALNAIYGISGIRRASAGWMLCDCLKAVHGVGMAVLCFSRKPAEIQRDMDEHIGKIIEADAECGTFYWEFQLFESLTQPAKLSSTALTSRLRTLLPQDVKQEAVKDWANLLGVELGQGKRGRPRKHK